MSSLTRRQAVLGVTSMFLLPASAGSGQRLRSNGSFLHGVASGDPDQDSVVIWTRLSGSEEPSVVRAELAADADFANVVFREDIETAASKDYTVKAIASGLQPGAAYYYRFSKDRDYSPVGRTRSLPIGHLDRLGIAVVSCSNFPFGYFNAYASIADDPNVDVVLHLGDYIYEYGPDGYGGQTGNALGRIHEPRRETLSLDDYRQRHAQYKMDEGSRAMHAAHPLICVWDDHESANNPWMQGAENHQPVAEGPWESRKQAAMQAYYEWMPVRDPKLVQDRTNFWRHYRFADLASLITLETRHSGRSEQLDYADYLDGIKSDTDAATFRTAMLDAPDRAMLSAPLQEFIGEALHDSVRSGVPWRLIGNQIPMARTHAPVLDHLLGKQLDSADTTVTADQRDYLQHLARLGQLDFPISLDTWDGYPAARENFYNICDSAGARDLLVLTGDSHAFWQNELFDARGARMGVEIGTTSVTSPGDFVGFGSKRAELIDGLLSQHNREVQWTDCRHHGYVRLDLTHDRISTDFVRISNILSPSYGAGVLRNVNIVRVDNHLGVA